MMLWDTGVRRLSGALRRQGVRAFTLAEMLVSTVITVVVAAALYAVLANGIAIWQRASATNELLDWRLLTDRFELDVRNAIAYRGIDWQGTSTFLQFPAVYRRSGNSAGGTIARMEYRFTADEGTLSRRAYLFEGVPESVQKAPGSLSVRNLGGCTFSYGFFEPQQNVLLWSAVWPPESSGGAVPPIPRAVRLTVQKESTGRAQVWERTVLIPLGKKW